MISIKKERLPILLVVASVSCTPGLASALTIEDKDIGLVGDSVSSAVYADKSFDPFKDYSCKIVGEKIALSTEEVAATYFLTTADACGWGAALGPVWLVRVSRGRASVVLSAGGYSVDALKNETNRMHDVTINGTAARVSSSVYKFNGVVYQKISKGRN
jgi:hypothetical protein